ncbi:MAG TPA: hypothetical protein VKA44_00565 [Gemmatimonadota bacterium]|nr:hypothetical protein [Gemmatimonadota bacterium]
MISRRELRSGPAWARALIGAPLAVGIAVGAPRPTRAQEVTYSGSLEYATGTYLFTERTQSAYLFSRLSVRTGRLEVSAALPVIYQSTPWVSYTTGGGVPTGGPQDGAVGDSLRRRGRGSGPMGMGSRARLAAALAEGAPPSAPSAVSRAVGGAAMGSIALPDTAAFDQVGVGDPTFRASVDLLPPERGDLAVTLSGEVKAPVADPDRGFGTGTWDGGGALSVSRRLGSTFLFGEVGYWVLGDLPELELRDPVTFSAGVGRRLGTRGLALLASVSGSTRILEGTDPPLDVGGGLSYRFADGRSLSLGISVGLSESSPDLGASLGWRIRL